MSKNKLKIPKDMVNITTYDKVVVKNTLTETNNPNKVPSSKANKVPSIKIITGDTFIILIKSDKPKIISDGKEWNVE